MPNLVILASDVSAPATVQGAFDSAIALVKTDALAMINSAVPVALAIGAATLVIRIGWNFFKSMAR